MAFSGTVDDEGVPYTEVGMNEGIKEKELPEKFGTDDFSFLIEANKYQTRFDQPLLHSMYVDRSLGGIQAIQTLSRLNRTTRGKNDTFVLDFVNEPEEIQSAFQPYYEKTIVGERSEYGKLYELQNKLKGFNVYFEEEVNEFCRFFFSSRKRLNPKDHLHHEFGADDEPHYFCTGLPVGVNNDLVSPWIKNRASRGPGIRSFRNPFDGWSNRLVSFFSIGVPHHRQALPRLAFNTSPLFTTLNK